MSRTQLIAVVIEWHGLRDEGPELIVAPDIEEATRRLMESIEEYDDALWGGLQFHDGTPPGWHLANPRPAARGSILTALEDWLTLYHEYAETPVWTMYRTWPNRLSVGEWHVASWLEPGWPSNVVDLTKTYDSRGQLVAVEHHREDERVPAAVVVVDPPTECACAVLMADGVCKSCGKLWRPAFEVIATFEVAAGTVADDNKPRTCDRCGRTHSATDCEHGDELR